MATNRNALPISYGLSLRKKHIIRDNNAQNPHLVSSDQTVSLKNNSKMKLFLSVLKLSTNFLKQECTTTSSATNF
jgi:hypothetical protein